MPFLLINHEVADYERWKPLYDEHSTTREQSGSQGAQLFRSADNPNHVVALIAWDSVENARSFATSANLRETMKGAGVLGKPELVYLEEIEKSSA